MNHFHVCKFFKSFILVTLSCVMLICSVPCFSIRSQAVGTTTLTYEAIYALYLALSTYLSSKGYSAPKLQSADGDMIVSDNRRNTKVVSDLMNSLYQNLNAYHPGTGDALEDALNKSIHTGRFFINEETDNFINSYLATQTLDSRVLIGTTNTRFDTFSASTSASYSFTVKAGQTSALQDCYLSVTPDVEFLPVVTIGNNNTPCYWAIPLESQSSSYFTYDTDWYYTYNGTTFPGFSLTGFSNNTYGSVNGVQAVNITNWIYSNLTFANGLYFTTSNPQSLVQSICSYLRIHGYYDLSANITSDQITDTSEYDILSSTSEIDETTGEVTGGTTIYLPDTFDLESLLNQYAQGAISYYEVLKQLGLSSVSSDAATSEKENALAGVKAPTADYDWLTSTMWGSETITRSVTQSITDSHAEENTKAGDIAESIGAPNGSEVPEEDKNKAGNAMLLATIAMWLGLWKWPDFDPSNPDGGGIVDPADNPFEESRTRDVIAGIGVASSILGDIFNSAGGSSGYGMVYTVGISFVLFSVIIGAGHFFGALGSEIQARSQEKEISEQARYTKSDRAKSARQGFYIKSYKRSKGA